MEEKKVKEEAKKIIGKGRRALRIGVNIFVYTLVGIFMLLMVVFSISQTSLFKDWLRDTVVEIVNGEINGKLSIGEIDGTIFTSIEIKNAVLTSLQEDTVVQVGSIEILTSPLKLLFKSIYVRKFELRDAKIKFVEESDGKLNLLKIFPSSDEPEDTTSSEFPFTIEVANFALANVDFSMQRYDKVGSKQFYPAMNMEDLRIKNLNVSFNAFADLNEYNYKLAINNISFSPNFENFQLKKLSGTILLTPQLTGINKLNIVTNESDIELSAAISGIDFIKDFSVEKLESAQMRFTLNAGKINFDDLITYIPALKILQGNVAAELEANGTLNEMNVKKLNLIYNNTSLNATAKLNNLLDADKMFLQVSLSKSILDPSDPNKLLREIDIPEYKELGLVKFDTLNYSGNPLDFKTDFAISTAKGSFRGSANLDLKLEEIKYDAKIFTSRLDLNPFISIPTDMNSEIDITGFGFSPQTMQMKLIFNAKNSRFGKKYLNDISIDSYAKNGLIETTLTLSSDSSSGDFITSIDFTNPDDPAYQINGKMHGINLARLLDIESLDSDLNLSLDASGQGFNPDSMDIFLVTDINNSRFLSFDIDSTRLILDVRRNDNGLKIINIVSDIADFTIKGDYTITTLTDVLARESKIMDHVLANKINRVFADDSVNLSLSENFVLSSSSNQKISLEYLLDFKDDMLVSLGTDQLQLNGQLEGLVNSNSDSINIVLKAQFDYLKYWNINDLYFLTNTKLNFDLSNHLIDGFSGNVKASLDIDAERIYAGGNIRELSTKIDLNNNNLGLDLSAKYEDNITVDLNADALIDEDKLNLTIKNFNTVYNNLEIKNVNDVLLSYSGDTINFDDFLLKAADGSVQVKGTFGANGNHTAEILIDSLNGNKIASDILGMNNLQSDIEVKAELTGNFSDPKFSVNSSAKKITYNKSNLGSLFAKLDYADNSLKTNIHVLDTLENFEKPALLVTGFIPLNLSEVKDSIDLSNESINLTIQSDEFNLNQLAGIIPYANFKQGRLETDIFVSGTVSKPIALGYFSIIDGQFNLTANNLDYDLNTKVWIDDKVITVENIELKNVYGTTYGGKLTGEGLITLNEFRLDSTYFKVNGDLKILDKKFKPSFSIISGDLAFKTKGDIIYNGKQMNSYLRLPVDVTIADIFVPLSKTAYSSNAGFIYSYKDYSSGTEKIISQLDSLIEAMNNKNNGDSIKTYTSGANFNYTIDIELDTEAEVTVNLSKTLDQNLVAILSGNFFYESIDGKKKSGGQLNLLEGSNLTFIKTLETTGTVKFDKIENPSIDITSMYKTYWLKDPNDSATEQEVAIKLKYKGPLSKLETDFINNEDNIGVYIGRQDIENDKKSATYNTADALFFLIAGNFPSDKDSKQDNNYVGEYTTEIAGSIVGSVLNKYLGDYVKSFQLRQVGTETKFSLIGKAWKFKYEIGGSTEALQDLSRAEVKIEYPITNKLQARVSRKEPENQSSSSNLPLFFEGGFKYNFEF